MINCPLVELCPASAAFSARVHRSGALLVTFFSLLQLVIVGNAIGMASSPPNKPSKPELVSSSAGAERASPSIAKPVSMPVLVSPSSQGDIRVPDFSSRYYTTDNHFWQDGDAPKSTMPKGRRSNLGDSLGNCTWYAYGGVLLEFGYNIKQLDALALRKDMGRH